MLRFHFLVNKSTTHVVEHFFKCEKEYIELLEDVKKIKDEHGVEVIGIVPPKCQLDGKYAAVQENSTQYVFILTSDKIITVFT